MKPASAQSAARVARRRGKIGPIVNQCETCDRKMEAWPSRAPVVLVGHHWRGYDFPLEVWWVCRRCNVRLRGRHDGSLTLDQARARLGRLESDDHDYHDSLLEKIRTGALGWTGGRPMTYAARLAKLYCDRGLPCEVEAGRVGLVVYAASRRVANAVAFALAVAPRSLGMAVEVTRATEEAEEPAETRWCSVVRFDWAAMPERVR